MDLINWLEIFLGDRGVLWGQSYNFGYNKWFNYSNIAWKSVIYVRSTICWFFWMQLKSFSERFTVLITSSYSKSQSIFMETAQRLHRGFFSFPVVTALYFKYKLFDENSIVHSHFENAHKVVTFFFSSSCPHPLCSNITWRRKTVTLC